MVEFWLGTFPIAGQTRALAEMAECDGWDGLAFTDSQSLSGDTFAALAIAAHATTTLKLATGATNPATRHAAVIASAIATIQAESDGRAVLGIARGDSALAYLGRPPMPVHDFGLALEHIQSYLRGQDVDLDGYASRIHWLRGQPKVPMSVAATGPRVIRLAARLAERVTFSVGAETGRLQAAIAVARAAPRDPALPPLSLGAYVNAVAHPDVTVARALVRGRMGVYARFSSMDRAVLQSLSAADRGVTEQLAATYDMHGHAASGARHEAALTDEFVDRFGIVGPADLVARRLRGLAALGLDHFVIVGHGRDTPPDVLRDSSARFARDVIPSVRGISPV
ncbi:MAG TPA: LLM class flavin-dependent oxidoreductase [Chloroflexota bacterium]